jgi:anti-sigma factor RsiW
MNHQPFEEWLLSEDDLAPEEDQALQEHLQTCGKCVSLNTAWLEVRREFETAPQVSPAPGFMDRWEARLAEERARQQRKQVLWVLGITSLIALTSFAIIIAQNWNELPTPIEILANLANLFAALVTGVQDLNLMIRVIFQAFPPLLVVGVWIATTMTLVVWIAIWFLTVWKIPSIKRSLT